MIDLDRPLRLLNTETSYEKIISYIRKHKGISMLDGHKIGVTAISQRCNEMKRNPKRYMKYLNGERVVGMKPCGKTYTVYSLEKM